MINSLIQEARDSDLVEIQVLYNQIDEQHHKALPNIFKPTQEIERPNAYIRSILEKDNAYYLVARVQNKVVGLVHIETRKTEHPLINPHKYGHISDIIVDSKWKRNGIGKQLIKESHEWFRKNGITEVNLTVFSFNKEAILFYQSLGYFDKHVTMACYLSPHKNT